MQFDQISRNIRQDWRVNVSIFGIILDALFRLIFQRNRTLRPDTSGVLQKSVPMRSKTDQIPKPRQNNANSNDSGHRATRKGQQ